MYWFGSAKINARKARRSEGVKGRKMPCCFCVCWGGGQTDDARKKRAGKIIKYFHLRGPQIQVDALLESRERTRYS